MYHSLALFTRALPLTNRNPAWFSLRPVSLLVFAETAVDSLKSLFSRKNKRCRGRADPGKGKPGSVAKAGDQLKVRDPGIG